MEILQADMIARESVAEKQADLNFGRLQQKRFTELASQSAGTQESLDQTEMKAPRDGVIVNLQAQEGMVAGIIRAGAIANLIVDQDPYILAAYRQENLKFVREGQPVVLALNTEPGRHFSGKVEEIWWASRGGQFLPSGELPIFPTFRSRRMSGFPSRSP